MSKLVTEEFKSATEMIDAVYGKKYLRSLLQATGSKFLALPLAEKRSYYIIDTSLKVINKFPPEVEINKMFWDRLFECENEDEVKLLLSVLMF